jgi:thioredoxin-like negative regulator of GroEL
MGAANSRTYDAQPELAFKMAQQQSLIVAFMSPQCGLCASLRPALDQVRDASGGTATVCTLYLASTVGTLP